MNKLAGLIGIVGGAAWLSLAWIPDECAPVTSVSEVFCNRLWTPPLLAMFIASLTWIRAVWARIGRVGRSGLAMITMGYGLLAFGNGGEYWLAYQMPHEGPDGWLRSVLWMTALVGWLSVLTGSTVVGGTALRGRFARRWVGAILLLAGPLTAVLGAAGYPAATLGIVGIVVGVLALAPTAEDAERRSESPALA